MKTNEGSYSSYMKKGFYHYPQPAGVVALKQFLLVERDGAHCLLLRFVNESALTVHAVEFVIWQMDAHGKALERSIVTYDSICIPPGDTFAHESAIIVKEGCVDFKIHLLSFSSDAYTYTLKRGQLIAHYDTRKSKAKAQAKTRAVQQSVDVKPCRRGTGRLYGWITALSLLLLCLACAWAGYRADQEEARQSLQHPMLVVQMEQGAE